MRLLLRSAGLGLDDVDADVAPGARDRLREAVEGGLKGSDPLGAGDGIAVEGDGDLDAELVRETLRAEGIQCTITLASSRETFLSAIETRPDIVLADHSLPGFDGSAAQRLVMERWPDVPFVLVSGSVGEERAMSTMRSGATDYVLKNQLRPLPGVVRRALKEAQERLRRLRAESEPNAVAAAS